MANAKNSKHNGSSHSSSYNGNSTTGNGGMHNGVSISNERVDRNDRSDRNERTGTSNGGSLSAISSSRQAMGSNSGLGNQHNNNSGGALADDFTGYSRERDTTATVPIATTSTSTLHAHSSSSSMAHKRIHKGKEPLKDNPPLDFNSLDLSVLRRYRRIYKLKIPDPASKETLVREITRHYTNLKVIENEVIVQFLYSVHNRDNVLKVPIP